MASKLMKNCSYVIKKLQIETEDISTTCQNAENPKHHHMIGCGTTKLITAENAGWCGHFGRQLGGFSSS